MSTLSYAIRGTDGVVVRGQTAEDAHGAVTLGQAKDVSLNLTPDEIAGYMQQGDDLVIHLASGETVTLEGYFLPVAGEDRSLFISKNGAFHQVDLGEPVVDQYFAQYSEVSISGKWSAYDELTFLDLERVEPVVAPLIAPIAGIVPGLLGVGGAAVAASAITNGGGSDGDGKDGGDNGGGDNGGGNGGGGNGGGNGGGGSTITPTVDDPDVDRIVGGTRDNSVTISGTGEAGSQVTVKVGAETRTTTIGSDGKYSVDFDRNGLPADGVYNSTVDVVAPGGKTHNLAGPSVDIDTTPPNVGVQDGTVSTNDIVNESEHTAGHEISGTGEAGAALTVEINGTTHSTTVRNDGTWSVTFAAGELNTGEYTTPVKITSTDVRGNVTTVNDQLRVDTQTSAAINAPVTADNVVNAAEANAGLTLTGTAEAGARVQVEIQGVTRTVTADNSGNWSATFASGSLRSGTYDTTVNVTSTDVAGNVATASHNFRMDTETSVTFDNNQVGDDIINNAEAARGFALTGTAEAGSRVVVQIENATRTVTADGNGNWTANFASGDLRQGEYDAQVRVTATDTAGNTATTTDTLRVDTSTAVNVDISTGVFATPVNAAQMLGGVVLEGTTEPNATVTVVVDRPGDGLAAVSRTVTSDASGNWSVSYASGTLPKGTYIADVNLSVTDAAGNTATANANFRVDTDITTPVVESVTFSGQDVTRITIDKEMDTAYPGQPAVQQDYEVHALNTNGTSGELAARETDLGGGETLYTLNQPAPDGTHLVIRSEDAAGNKSDTLLVLDDNATNTGTLNHAAIGNFNIEAIDLDYAASARLTLTEQQIKDLSETSDTLTIHGGDSDAAVNDQIEVLGAVKTNQTETIDGQTYDVYTVGNDGVTLVVDQDINVIV